MKNYTLRIATGLIIILIGAAFLLNNLNILSFGHLFGIWWPLLVILAGVVILLNDMRSYLWSLLVIGLGVVFQLNVLEVIDVNPWQLLWPAVIIVVGLSIMKNHAKAVKKNASDDDIDNTTAVLGGSNKKITSKDFKGGNITALFGGVQLDLTNAVIKKEATIRITSFCGGAEIIVPKGVIVRNQVSPLLGGVEDSTTGESETKKDAPILNITGDIIFSGVELKNS